MTAGASRAPAAIALGATYVAISAVTVAIARADPADALGGAALGIDAELCAGALLIVAALSVPRSQFSVLLAATGLAVPLAEWSSPGAGAAFTAGLLVWPAWPPLLAAAALRGRGIILALPVFAALILGPACAAVFDPIAQGCVGCPANLVFIHGSGWRTLSRAGLALTIAGSAAVMFVLALRIIRDNPSARRIAAPVLVPAATALVLYGAQAVHGLDRGFMSNDATDRALLAGQLVALALTAVGVGAARVYRRRTRASLAKLVVELGAAPAAGELSARLARALNDPELLLLHRRDDGAWIDGDGRETAPPAGRELTPVVAGGQAISALVHRPGLLDDGADIARAARLALEHERLQALHRARLHQLRASRARLVKTADDERRRLERDLHDGAQQRLVALALQLRLARRGNAALDARLGPAEAELRAAVAELRDLARGLYPAVLADEGLAAALETLAEEVPGLELGPLAEGRLPQAVESTAYFVAAESRAAHVETRRGEGSFVVGLRGAHLTTRIEDRVGAAGGTIASGKEELTVELPCA